MPTKRTQTYQYKPGDSPLTVSSQFNVTPQQLLQANAGGFPFSTGQTIQIPFQYSAPIGPQPLQFSTPQGPQPAYSGAPPVGYGPNSQPTRPPQPTYPTNTFLSGSGQNVADYYNQNILGLNTTPTELPTSTGAPLPGTQQAGSGGGSQAGATDFQQTKAALYNAANNVPFLQQKRWDDKRKKYITVGQWMRESQRKFNKKGKYVGDRKPKQQQQQVQQSQDYTLANAIINLGVSAG
jgi:hypothetical protein